MQQPQPEIIHRFGMPMFQRFAVLSWADTAAVPSRKRMESQLITISHDFIQDVAGKVMIANPVKDLITRFIRRYVPPLVLAKLPRWGAGNAIGAGQMT